jgi:hypothetical protein
VTVHQFPARGDRRPRGRRPFSGGAEVTGRFASPSGRTGAFRGAYRLDRFVTQFGQLAASGVFTGVLTDADGARIGFGSRHHTVAVELVVDQAAVSATIGPLEVNLLGFAVAVDEFTMPVRRGLPAVDPPLVGEASPAPGLSVLTGGKAL